jgi:hypothetical protein
MQIKKIIEVKLHHTGRGWLIPHQHGDVKTNWTLPSAALDYRSAEYGIDRGDVETLMDVLMHEQMLSIHEEDPKFVYNTDQDSAREYLFEQIAEIKKDVQWQDPENHLLLIQHTHHQHHDPELHGNHRKFCEAMRKRKKQ